MVLSVDTVVVHTEYLELPVWRKGRTDVELKRLYQKMLWEKNDVYVFLKDIKIGNYQVAA